MASVLNPAIAAFVCSYMLAYVTQRIVSQEPGGARRRPGGARRNQEEARRSQGEPGGARRSQEEPGGALASAAIRFIFKGNQEEPGERATTIHK